MIKQTWPKHNQIWTGLAAYSCRQNKQLSAVNGTNFSLVTRGPGKTTGVLQNLRTHIPKKDIDVMKS